MTMLLLIVWAGPAHTLQLLQCLSHRRSLEGS